LRDAITRDFGSYERWRSEFVAMGKALGGGSGWVLLSWSENYGQLAQQAGQVTAPTNAAATYRKFLPRRQSTHDTKLPLQR